MEEIDSSQARRVYLITYSQADLNKFPTRESFGRVVAGAFTNNSFKVRPTHWACCLEQHQDGQSVHYHVALALSGPKRWLDAKRRIQAQHGVVVHFAENDGEYHSAYKYVCKSDNAVFHSEGHPNLAEVGSPPTKKAMRGYHKRRASKAATANVATAEVLTTEVAEEPCASKKTCVRLTRPEVCDFCIKNNIKTRTELLSVALEQKKQGKLDLANFVLNRTNFIDSILFGIDSMVRSVVSTEKDSKVCLQRSLKSANDSCMIFIDSASSLNFALTLLKTFSIGLQSGLRAGMLNMVAPTSSIASFAFRLFWEGSPSCKNNFPCGLELSLKRGGKTLFTNAANVSTLRRPSYCSAKITPRLYAIAQLKCATRPPVPSCDPLVVLSKFKPSFGLRHAIDGGARA